MLISYDSIFYNCICPLRDILYPCRTKIHVVKNMIEMFMSNLWIITPTMWACFIVYAVWYSTKAKNYAPLTPVEARQLWVIHQQSANCSSRKWRQVKHRGITVGFECSCGHKHIQLRPIVAHLPSPPVPLQTPDFNTLQPSNRTS
jgi:hypothetical protein